MTKNIKSMPVKDGFNRYIFMFNRTENGGSASEIIEAHASFVNMVLDEFEGELLAILHQDLSDGDDAIVESSAFVYIKNGSLSEMNSSLTLNTMDIGNSNVEVVEFETGHWQQYEKVSVIEGTLQNGENGDRDYVDNLNKNLWPIKMG
jgi:hypothetical protein